MPSDTKIRARMAEFADILSYESHDLSHLAKAMYCRREGKRDYTNDAMATLGDAVLKLIWSEYFFSLGLDKDEITRRKASLEKNATLKALCDKVGVYGFAYNDDYFGSEAPKKSRLPYGNHDFYLEAIIAAIYLDRGLDYTRDWVIHFWKKHGDITGLLA